MWAIWVKETLTVEEKFLTEQDAESWIEHLVSDPDSENLWLKTTRGFIRLSSIDEFRIGKLAK